MSRSSSIADLTALARDKSAPIDVRLGRLLTLGDALAETGSLNKAAKTFELAVKLKPDSHGAYYSLGVALGRAHHAEHAHFAFAHATILNPNHAPSHRALALAASMLGKSEEAAVSLRRALHLEPTFHRCQFTKQICASRLVASADNHLEAKSL